jgi:hypothetical protein
LTPHGLAEVTLETAASVRADCALAPPRHSAMAEMARAILRSFRRGFTLPPSRHSEIGRAASTQMRFATCCAASEDAGPCERDPGLQLS